MLSKYFEYILYIHLRVNAPCSLVVKILAPQLLGREQNSEIFRIRPKYRVVTIDISNHCQTPDEQIWNKCYEVSKFIFFKIINAPFWVAFRLLWFLVVVTSFSLLMYVLTSRLLLYWDYTSRVNVEITYMKKMPFPAVTICNDNIFRWIHFHICGDCCWQDFA